MNMGDPLQSYRELQETEPAITGCHWFTINTAQVTTPVVVMTTGTVMATNVTQWTQSLWQTGMDAYDLAPFQLWRGVDGGLRDLFAATNVMVASVAKPILAADPTLQNAPRGVIDPATFDAVLDLVVAVLERIRRVVISGRRARSVRSQVTNTTRHHILTHQLETGSPPPHDSPQWEPDRSDEMSVFKLWREAHGAIQRFARRNRVSHRRSHRRTSACSTKGLPNDRPVARGCVIAGRGRNREDRTRRTVGQKVRTARSRQVARDVRVGYRYWSRRDRPRTASLSVSP